jgi:hypothetical protein
MRQYNWNTTRSKNVSSEVCNKKCISMRQYLDVIDMCVQNKNSRGSHTLPVF